MPSRTFVLRTTHSLASTPSFFNVRRRKAGGHGIRSHVQYITVRRVVQGRKLSVGEQKVSDFQSVAAHNTRKIRLYSVKNVEVRSF